MAAILLLSLVILLAIYCKCDFRKILSTLQKQFPNGASKEKLFSLAGTAGHNTSKTKKLLTVWDIPGPFPLPFVGTRWIFFGFFKNYTMSKLHEVYKDLNARYGSIVLEVLPSAEPMVHLFNKEDIEKVLKYPSRYPYRPPTDIVVYFRNSRPDRYASVGITNAQGKVWHNLRTSLTSSITSPRMLQNFLPVLNSICDDFINLLRDRRNPQTMIVENFEDITNLMGLEAVCTLMLGRRMGFLAPDAEQPEKIKQLAAAVKQLFISLRDSYYGFGLWKYIPTKTYLQFSKSEEIIYDVISEIVEKALAEEKNGDSKFDKLQSIFLDILNDEGLDIREKKSAIIDFIAAGIETLANTVIFVLSSVTNHKNAVGRILEEFKEHQNSDILQDAITKATYTKACLQETYRICPTAFCLARVLETETTLSGYTLEKGTVILCQNMIACHKDSNFRDATIFRPERWIDENGMYNVNSLNSSSIVLPFGIGRRTCPGKRFVEMEIMLLLSKLILAFEISFVKPMEVEFEFMLVPKTPINLILKDRAKI